jgi:hypothetical protein
MNLIEATNQSADISCANKDEKEQVLKILHYAGFTLDTDYNGGLVIGLMCDKTYDIDETPVSEMSYPTIPASQFIASNTQQKPIF